MADTSSALGHRWHVGLALAALVAGAMMDAGGCGRPAGQLFPPVADAPRWPPPPEEPRIRYLGQLATSDDLKAAQSFGDVLARTVFGKGDVHTMLSPYALCTDGQDRLFVADSNAQCVHVFNLKTRAYAEWRPAKADKGFSQPVGIAYDPAGRLLVADSVAGVLFAFDTQGKPLGGLGAGLLRRPCGVAVDPASRRVYVADTGAHQVVVLSPEGALVSRLGERGSELGQFNYPTNVAVDRLGRLYVSDALNSRVQLFDADLKPLRQIGRKGDMPGTFSQPRGLAVDRDNHLYVIDIHFEAIQIFDDKGVLLLTLGNEGHEPGEFWMPTGLFIDPQSRIWVADSYNRRVQVLEYLPEELP